MINVTSGYVLRCVRPSACRWVPWKCKQDRVRENLTRLRIRTCEHRSHPCVACLQPSVCLLRPHQVLDPQCFSPCAGTGTNACYMEDEADIETLDNCEERQGGLMCINTEWGAFGENGTLDNIRTECDAAVDQGSINPGQMMYVENELNRESHALIDAAVWTGNRRSIFSSAVHCIAAMQQRFLIDGVSSHNAFALYRD